MSGRCCRNCSTASSPLLACATTVHVGLEADDPDDAFAHQPVVVDAQDANRGRRHAGERSAAGGDDKGATASTAVPWPG